MSEIAVDVCCEYYRTPVAIGFHQLLFLFSSCDWCSHCSLEVMLVCFPADIAPVAALSFM